MTVELDKEKGPQVPVIEGKEPPCFIRLFNGRMIVHTGKRDVTVSTRWRLFIVRNELPYEAYLWEIPVNSCNLRSRGSFIVVDCHKGALYVWHGCKSSAETKLRAREIADQLVKRCPTELGLQSTDSILLTELSEGSECKEFWQALNGKNYATYSSLLLDDRPYDHSPRLFHMSASAGVFEATEILNPTRSNDATICSPFPFLQVDLYCATQPALFLLDNQYEVYLWVGWWPTADTDGTDSSAIAGSAEVRFTAARRCAMETILDYCNVRYSSTPPVAYIVYAGKEPLRFTNLFPYWQTDETVASLVGATFPPELKDLELVDDALAKLTVARVYTWEELQERPLPDGVDMERLETYLATEEFEEVLGMTRVEFSALPTWKQTKLKKDIGLF
jgi:supervillin